MLNQELEGEAPPPHQRRPNHHLSNDHHNPLNDHDYCSPNKKITQRQPSSKFNKDSKSNNNFVDPTTLPSSSLPIQTSVASSSPDPQRNESRFDNSKTISKTFSTDNLSDSSSSSSSSSSLSSSFASTKELVIAQDSNKPGGSEITATKETPAKRKVGRPPGSTKKEMDDGLDQSTGRVRAKRARQSTSVTDKSEWIMGDDQIDSVLSEQLGDEPREKRHKPNRELDSAFSQYTSSDYSSSDAESDDQESDCNSEDDPNRLWCVCQKPHEGKFMICCDICKDWFHGHCVGVTKLMGDRFEKQGKEWFCGECQEKLRSGIPRNAIPKKIVKKEKEKKISQQPVHGKRGRGRPRKSESLAKEGATRVSQRSTRKSSSSLDPKLGVDNGRLKKNLARSSDARTESFDDFQDQQKLKQLIRERKKAFFYKRHLAEQQKAARRSELGLGRQALTANLSDSLDSLASTTSTPNMSNLPINIKSEHRERSKPNIVLQINTKKDAGSDQSNPRIVTAIVRSPKKSKHVETRDPKAVNDLFTAEPIQISKKVKTQASITSPVAANQPIVGDANASNGDASIRKRSNSGSSTSKNEKLQKGHGEPVTPKKKRKDSESSAPNGSLTPCNSKQVSQKIKEALETRSKQIEGLEVTSDKIETLAKEIEVQLSECFKEGTQKYLTRFRALFFNLRDHKNQGLVRNVLTGEIPPAKLVRMSSDEMASHELAKWREMENKHSIELIKRDAQLAAQQVIVKKTHKGEEVISAPSLNEPDDSSAKVDNQEPPTTPTKSSSRETRADSSKITLTPPLASGAVKSSGPLKMKITGLGLDSSIKATSQDVAGPSCATDSLPFLDTTKDHKAHIFDINCKICTKQKEETDTLDVEIKQTASNEDKERQPSESEQQAADQPKRLRISIDTKLKPTSLSRLSEPLVKPILQPSSPMDVDSYSPSRISPEADSTTAMEEDDDDAYDPEASNLSTFKSMEIDSLDSQSKEPCWTGTITMPDIAKFSAAARAVSGSVNFMKEEINQSLMVCGRIAPDQVQGYIKKLKTTTKNQILIIQLFPLAEDDKQNFDTFFDYLYSRNRYGVIQTSPQILKDFYVLPIHEKSNIPEVLKPIKGPGFDRKETNCLLGLLVRSKRSPSTSYAPTPLK